MDEVAEREVQTSGSAAAPRVGGLRRSEDLARALGVRVFGIIRLVLGGGGF